MTRSAGELDRRIVIERATSTTNAYNEPVKTWSTHLQLPAKRSDASDGERFASGQLGSYLMTRFVVRSSVATRGILPTDRISHEGKIWNIQGIKETDDGRRTFLEITAVSRASDEAQG